MSDYFEVHMSVPRLLLKEDGAQVTREEFYTSASDWAPGLLGIYQGTVLACDQEEDAVDIARVDDRDWLERQDIQEVVLYFDALEQAKAAQSSLLRFFQAETTLLSQQKADWDAQWKKSFSQEFEGFACGSFLIVPAFREVMVQPQQHVIRINPGAGFGTGTHPTTQLCCQLITQRAATHPILSALDFGAGSGVLAILLKLLGASVHAVEIDTMALDNAKENAELSGAIGIEMFETLPPVRTYDLVVANILRPVLVEFQEELCKRLSPQGVLILSGLIEQDLVPIQVAFASLECLQIVQNQEWYALCLASR